MGMDNAEAIKRIKDHIRVRNIGEYPHIKIAEALSLAISALANDNNVGHKQELVRCQNCRHWGRHTQFNLDYGVCYRFHCKKHENGFCELGETIYGRKNETG